jgi:hypothetical protein
VTSNLRAADLIAGSNAARVCVRGRNNLTGELGIAINRDDTAPVTTASPGTGSFGTAQSVTLSCSDKCNKTIYTTNGTEPAMDISGNISNGSQFSIPIQLADQSATVIKYRSLDLAGNIEAVKESQYTIDTDLPGISITPPSPYYVSANGSSAFSWATDRFNLPYYIYLNSADCGTGTLLASGTVTGNPNPITIYGNGLSSGSNSILICESNLVGNYGSSSTIVYLDNTVPVISHHFERNDDNLVNLLYVFTCSDSGSGCDSFFYTFNGIQGTALASSPLTLVLDSIGTAEISINARDNAGHYSGAFSDSICISWECLKDGCGCDRYPKNRSWYDICLMECTTCDTWGYERCP